MFSFGSQSPIFHQTRELHRDTSTTLALQECIRMHRASLKSFRLGLGRMPPSESLQTIQRRLEDIAEQLEFYQSTCLTILEQQRNLLNMVRYETGFQHRQGLISASQDVQSRDNKPKSGSIAYQWACFYLSPPFIYCCMLSLSKNHT